MQQEPGSRETEGVAIRLEHSVSGNRGKQTGLYKPGPRALLLKIAACAALLASLCMLQPQPGEAAAGAWTDTPQANYCGGLITAPFLPNWLLPLPCQERPPATGTPAVPLVAPPRGQRAYMSSARCSTPGSKHAFASQQPSSKQG